MNGKSGIIIVSKSIPAPGRKADAMKRTVSLILVVTMLVMCLSGCSLFSRLFEPKEAPQTTDKATQGVEEMAARCVAACNRADIDGILDCIAPEVAAPLRSMMNLAGKLGNMDDDELLGAVLGLLGADTTGSAMEVCRTLRVDALQDLEISGDEATAKVHFEFTQDGTDYEGDTNITCVCIDGRWYLKKLSV